MAIKIELSKPLKHWLDNRYGSLMQQIRNQGDALTLFAAVTELLTLNGKMTNNFAREIYDKLWPQVKAQLMSQLKKQPLRLEDPDKKIKLPPRSQIMFSNAVNDLEMSLGNAAEFGRQFDFCYDILNLFSFPTDDLTQLNLYYSLGNALYHTDGAQASDEFFDKLFAKHPQSRMYLLYMYLTHLLYDRPDVPKAVQVLERDLAETLKCENNHVSKGEFLERVREVYEEAGTPEKFAPYEETLQQANKDSASSGISIPLSALFGN